MAKVQDKNTWVTPSQPQTQAPSLINGGKDPLTQQAQKPIEVQTISAEYQPTWNANVTKKAAELNQIIGEDKFGNVHRAKDEASLQRIISAYDQHGIQALKQQVEDANANADQRYQDGLNEGQANMEAYVNSVIGPMQQQYQAQIAQAYANANRANAATINQNRDMSAREYYQLYKTLEKDLPENLSKAGVTGGASESASLKLMSDYANNILNNENARNAELNGEEAAYNERVAANSAQMANTLANQYYQAAMDKIAYDRNEARYQQQLALDQAEKEADRQAEAEALEAEQRAAAAKASEIEKIDAWNDSVMRNISKREAEGYKVNKWKDSTGRWHYSLAGKKKVTSTSSSGSSSKSSGGNTGDYNADKLGNDGNNYLSYNDALEKIRISMTGNSTYNQYVPEVGKQKALETIKRFLDSGQITQAVAERVAKELKLV